MNEKFQTAAEAAEMRGVSRDTVRRLFADEPGVIDLGRHVASCGKRRYRVLRIPSAVVARFLERRSVKQALVGAGRTGRTRQNKEGAEMTGIQIIRQENLTAPHVLIGMTAEAAVITPLTKVLEAMEDFQNGKTRIALLPCVVLASEGVLVQDHLIHMPAGAVLWFEVPKPGRIRSMLGTMTKDAEQTVSAFLRCYFITKDNILVVAKTEDDYQRVLEAIAV
jgi:hypothetical protein